MKPEDIERIAPGLGRLMPEVGDRTWKAYYAAQAGNWPLAKFQAVQDLIARLAAESAAATAVVDAAARAGAELRAVAAAKIRTATAASEGTRLAHQIHGAIGVTYEHQLHNLTTRLWSWRDEFGTEARWARVLGERVAADGAPGFWEWLVSSGAEAA